MQFAGRCAPCRPLGGLLLASSLLCSSGPRFATDFLQTPPHLSACGHAQAGDDAVATALRSVAAMLATRAFGAVFR